MSRLFCLTSRMSDEMMLSAPTMTIRPIVIEIAIFSSQSAEKSERFMLRPILGDVFRTELAREWLEPRRCRPDVVHTQLNEVRRLLREQPLREIEAHEPVGRIGTRRDRVGRCRRPAHAGYAGSDPIGDSEPPGVISVTSSPTETPSCCARSCPSRMPGPHRPRRSLRQAEQAPLLHRPFDVRDLAFEDGIDSLSA